MQNRNRVAKRDNLRVKRRKHIINQQFEDQQRYHTKFSK